MFVWQFLCFLFWISSSSCFRQLLSIRTYGAYAIFNFVSFHVDIVLNKLKLCSFLLLLCACFLPIWPYKNVYYYLTKCFAFVFPFRIFFFYIIADVWNQTRTHVHNYFFALFIAFGTEHTFIANFLFWDALLQ